MVNLGPLAFVVPWALVALVLLPLLVFAAATGVAGRWRVGRKRVAA